MRLEFQIIALLFLSAAALAVEHFVPRTQSVGFTGEQWRYDVSYDPSGTSASVIATDRGLEMDVDLVDAADYPFASLIVAREVEAGPLNLSWFSQVRIRAFIDGKDKEHFRIFLRNRFPETYIETDPEQRQYNVVGFELTNEPKTIQFDREKFHVPSWWAETYGTEPHHEEPTFDCVDCIEFSTGSSLRETNVKLIVESIELQGSWMPPLVLYRALLASWLVLGLGVLANSTVEYRRKLKQSFEREDRLKLINSSLATQATNLSKLAHYDELTGLPNRLGFKSDPRVASESLKTLRPVSLVIFDIDHFKAINDSRGHNFGDEILADLGSLLSKSSGDTVLFARWGGEEFISLCFGASEQAACEFAESLRATIESAIGITCSFGVCEVAESECWTDTLGRADRVMYESKAKGRNRVLSFSKFDQNGNRSNPWAV